LFGSVEKIFLEKYQYILNNEVTSKYLRGGVFGKRQAVERRRKRGKRESST
jgi:hypothetical protein